MLPTRLPTRWTAEVERTAAAAPEPGIVATAELLRCTDCLIDGEAVIGAPDAVRGIYLNAWAFGSPRRRAQLMDLADRTANDLAPTRHPT
jgi:hypothetical protein